MKTTIFYFSATGNSLYTAKKLAEIMGDSSIDSMTKEPPMNEIGDKNEAVGFIFPSYYGDLPRLVRKFISELKINPASWIFCVSTIGAPLGLGQGSVAALEQLLFEKGLRLCYGRGITMPRNYVMAYNPLPPESGTAANKKADVKLRRIADDIKARKPDIRKSFLTSKKLYENIESLDESFYAESHCNGCGVCEKICPVKNIELSDGKPKWKHKCEHCAACISWCPQKAIQYNEKTKMRRRYRNPSVKISDLTD